MSSNSNSSTSTKTAKEVNKPAADAMPVLYDAAATQAVVLNIDGYRVNHVIAPLSNERYFEFERAVLTAVKRASKVATSLYTPKETLWRELCTGVRGYKPRDDWKDAMDQAEAVQAMNAYMHVEVLPADETGKEGEYDPTAAKKVEFRTLFCTEEGESCLLTLAHEFRPDSKAERDEFLAIETDMPNESALASLDSASKAEKLARLGAKLLVEKTGYADGSHVPAWHLAATTESFFARQIGKMGRSLKV